ncbi:3-hydroxyisobutyrate dehydrogenase family protein [hydrothermal vent metagenome]|uniref:3-hydroxyisobutyrate dehydrogenase family protein n=1 Tax=hydrothermal vent metagenome TaxID=652676 RepID=A0A3B0TYU7_9ZZZZ
MTQKIGFIGIGLMGYAMCRRLLDHGHDLTIIAHRNRTRIEDLVARGATEATSYKELAAASDIICFCVTTSDAVEASMAGETGVLAGMKPGAMIIDFGTSEPGSTKRLGAEVEAKGGHYMDAPLGRTPSHALEGKLNIMAGGRAEDYRAMKPLFDQLGENVFHVGDLGAGHTIKLINNCFAMTTALAMSEAFGMATAAGVDKQILYDVMAAGPLHSGMMDFIKANAIDGVPDKLAFAMVNARKDVNYALQMCQGLGISPVIGPCTLKLLDEALKGGFGEKHIAQMSDFVEEKFTGKA